jgi:hypothetical protein
MKQSDDYLENYQNASHYLVSEVNEMLAKAPGLKRYEIVKE